MEKSIENKLKAFLEMYSNDFDDRQKEFILNNMESYLSGEVTIDLLAEVAYAINEEPKNGNIYREYLEFLKSHYDICGDVLEVGCGSYPAFASILDKHQTKSGKGTIEVYDPEVIVSKLGNIKINREKFTSDTEVGKYSLVTAMFPCDPTIDLIRKANASDKDFAILLCECVPTNGFIYNPYYSPYMWHNHVYNVAKESVQEDRIIDVAYIDKVDTPIIYSKRKR